jgi:hypothetical protein
MRLPIHCRFCRLSPPLASASCAVICILTSLGGVWLFEQRIFSFHSGLVFKGIGAGIGASVVATWLAWLLMSRIRQEHAAIQKLNHELRNALQIVQCVYSSCAPEAAVQARVAVARITSSLATVSEQLGHKRRSIVWSARKMSKSVA